MMIQMAWFKFDHDVASAERVALAEQHVVGLGPLVFAMKTRPYEIDWDAVSLSGPFYALPRPYLFNSYVVYPQEGVGG